MRPPIRLLLAAALLLATAAPAVAHAPVGADAKRLGAARPAMRAAVQAFLDRDRSPCAYHFYLRPEAWVGDWARATVLCKTTDDAVVYLRRRAGRWQVVAIGTGWPPADLDHLGIPAAVRAP